MNDLYFVWRGMLERCQNENHVGFSNYGGRGIAVCDRWQDFKNFVADVGERQAGTTLDRIDNDKGYEPGNVRWSTRQQQANNKRNSVVLGTGLSLADSCRSQGVNYQTAYARLAKGQSPLEAREKLRGSASPRAKLDEKTVLAIRGLRGSAPNAEIAARFGVSTATVSHIMTRRNWSHLP